MKLFILCALVGFASANSKLPAIAEILIDDVIRGLSSFVRSPKDDKSYECVRSILRTEMTEVFVKYSDDLPDSRALFERLPILIERAIPMVQPTIKQILGCPSGEMQGILHTLLMSGDQLINYVEERLKELTKYWPCVLENFVVDLVAGNYSTSCVRACWNDDGKSETNVKEKAALFIDTCNRHTCAAECNKNDVSQKCGEPASLYYYGVQRSIVKTIAEFQWAYSGEKGRLPWECQYGEGFF